MAIINQIKEFDNRYFEKINLVASENLSSPDVRYALQSDLHHRYAIPPEGKRDPAIWEYPNQQTIRNILEEASDVACALFHAAQADLTPLSGNQIAAIMLTNLLEEGDVFFSVGPKCGGHFTTEKIARERGYKRLDLPYDASQGIIDVPRAAEEIKASGAKLVFLDASMILFPYPVGELRAALGDDVIISYDASHTLGMIAGQTFQSPLEEGANFLHGSTHKSLWGPQKGMILSAKPADQCEHTHKVFSNIVPLFVSNAHPHHIAALGIALEEARDYGRFFARHTIKNARLMGETLLRRGLNVCFPEKNFTECHQIIVKIGTKPEALAAFRRLEAANINVNAISMPFAQEGIYGLRIGLSEITRRGMVGSVTTRISGLVADAILDERKEEAIRKEIMEISSAHRHVHYSSAAPTPELPDAIPLAEKKQA